MLNLIDKEGNRARTQNMLLLSLKDKLYVDSCQDINKRIRQHTANHAEPTIKTSDRKAAVRVSHGYIFIGAGVLREYFHLRIIYIVGVPLNSPYKVKCVIGSDIYGFKGV